MGISSITPAHPSIIRRTMACRLAVVRCCLTHTRSGRGRLYCSGDSSGLTVYLIMSPKLSALGCRFRLRPFACPHAADANA